MLRKTLCAGVAAAALLVGAQAWAITTNLTITGQSGQALKGKLVKLTVIPPKTSTARTRTVEIRTNKDGKITQIPDFDLTAYPPNETTVRITYTDGGKIVTDEMMLYQLIPSTGGPPPTQNISTIETIDGFTVGGELTKNWACFQYQEYSRTTGDLTSQNSACNDPIGGGIMIGMPIAVGIGVGNTQVMPFLSVDYLNSTAAFNFANGAYLSSKGTWMGTLGVKMGPRFTPSLWTYGVLGASFLTEKLTISFLNGTSTATKTVPGVTLGLGVAYKPDFWQDAGRPLSVFLEINHSWWQNAHFDTPPNSTAFNYTFPRNDTTLKTGIMIALGGQRVR